MTLKVSHFSSSLLAGVGDTFRFSLFVLYLPFLCAIIPASVSFLTSLFLASFGFLVSLSYFVIWHKYVFRCFLVRSPCPGDHVSHCPLYECGTLLLFVLAVARVLLFQYLVRSAVFLYVVLHGLISHWCGSWRCWGGSFCSNTLGSLVAYRCPFIVNAAIHHIVFALVPHVFSFLCLFSCWGLVSTARNLFTTSSPGVVYDTFVNGALGFWFSFWPMLVWALVFVSFPCRVIPDIHVSQLSALDQISPYHSINLLPYHSTFCYSSIALMAVRIFLARYSAYFEPLVLLAVSVHLFLWHLSGLTAFVSHVTVQRDHILPVSTRRL